MPKRQLEPGEKVAKAITQLVLAVTENVAEVERRKAIDEQDTGKTVVCTVLKEVSNALNEEIKKSEEE